MKGASRCRRAFNEFDLPFRGSIKSFNLVYAIDMMGARIFGNHASQGFLKR